MTASTNSVVLSFGFVGLGNMGTVMSRLVEHGFFEVSDTLEDVAKDCDIIHACLANDEAAKPGVVVADHSTLYPTTSSILFAEAEAKGLNFLSCPVFGPPSAAKSASLLVVVSGNDKSRELLKSYVVPSLGRATIDCGGDTRKVALLKILGNSCILGTIELLSESFTLAEKKVSKQMCSMNLYVKQWFPAPAWMKYGRKIRDGGFSGTTGFAIPGGMKDALYIRRLGAWNHLTTAKSLGGESLDWSSCSAGMRVTAGLPPFKGEDFTLAKK
ncbi:NAD(P)-binding protein [Jackrogersella minutella]|nr:NAD(P)-binding protein [Jackrogersella minutella]